MIIARQTLAMLLDAYRELNARKLFWFCTALSGLIVAIFAAIGINEEGMTILWFKVDVGITSREFAPALFYKNMFSTFGVGLWLSWLGIILALVSTAGLFPDLNASGAIDLMMSKPISRMRLWMTKYLCGLLFVLLQSAIFSIACFMLIGVRGGSWEWGILLTAPIVVLMFSYLFCVCALLGTITRSTIAALLLTLLFWFALFVIDSGDRGLMSFRVMRELQASAVEGQIESLKSRLARREAEEAATRTGDAVPVRAEPSAGGVDAPAPGGPQPALPGSATPRDGSKRGLLGGVGEALKGLAGPNADTLRDQLAKAERDLIERRRVVQSVNAWHRWVVVTKTVLPKTSETTQLMRRMLVSLTDVKVQLDNNTTDVDLGDNGPRVSQRRMALRMEEEMRGRTPTWIIGTSMAFQVVVLVVGCWIFARRDF